MPKTDISELASLFDKLSGTPEQPKTLDTMSANQKAFFLFLIAIPGVFWAGWAISILWGWFIVPLGDVPAINAAHGAGLHVLFIALKASATTTDTSKLVPSKVAYALLSTPPFLVGMGWCIKYFI